METSIRSMTSPEEVQVLKPDITALYKDIFGAEPWNEGKRCPSCGEYFSFQSAPKVCCQGPLVDFYSDAEVDESLDALLERDYQLVLSFDGGQPIGFYWGWEASLDTINTQKLSLSPDALAGLSQRIIEQGGNPGRIYYSAEAGVLPTYRGKGFYSAMYRAARARVVAEGPIFSLIRTTQARPVPFEWRRCIGFGTLYDYEDQAQRVIMGAYLT